MKIIEIRNVGIIGTKSNKAVLNIPSSIAKHMKIEKGTKVVLQMLENGQLLIEKAK